VTNIGITLTSIKGDPNDGGEKKNSLTFFPSMRQIRRNY
jgi:hypothetical protein